MEIEEKQQVDVNALIEAFYGKKWYASYSALKKLIWSPQQFFNYYILNQKEEKLEKHLIDGKVIHCFMLNEEMFDQLFVVSPMNLPKDNNRLIVDVVHREWLRIGKDYSEFQETWLSMGLSDFGQHILSLLKDINLHQALVDDKKANAEGIKVTGDQKRLEKALNEENRNYFEFLKKKGAKDVIDQETYNRCKAAADRLRNNAKIREFLGMDVMELDNVEVFNEIQLTADFKKFNWGIKGIIDNYTVNHDTKLIRINDLKTSGKSLSDFPESVEFFQYWLQAIIYLLLIKAKYKDLIKDGYTVEFRFIVIDNANQIYPFKVKQTTLQEWYDKAMKLLGDADYHYSKRVYDLPLEFSKGLVEL